MTVSSVLAYLGLWSLVGAAAFSLYVVFVFRSGEVYEARNEEGHLKKEMPVKGILSMVGFLVLVTAFTAGTNYVSLVSRQIELDFWPLFTLNLGLITILIVYDTLVIDWWVIGHWRPGFLRLPETMNKQEMKEHIRRTFITGPVFALLLAFLSAGVTLLVW